MTLNIANLDRLISHLEGLPEERFNMGHMCGTACCITGHSKIIFGEYADTAINLVLYPDQYGVLIMPPDWSFDREGYGKYPLSRAIRTLKHMRAEFLRTGQVVVDWDAPEPAARKDWVAPKVSEQKLPAEITKLLTTFDRVEVL